MNADALPEQEFWRIGALFRLDQRPSSL